MDLQAKKNIKPTKTETSTTFYDKYVRDKIKNVNRCLFFRTFCSSLFSTPFYAFYLADSLQHELEFMNIFYRLDGRGWKSLEIFLNLSIRCTAYEYFEPIAKIIGDRVKSKKSKKKKKATLAPSESISKIEATSLPEKIGIYWLMYTQRVVDGYFYDPEYSRKITFEPKYKTFVEKIGTNLIELFSMDKNITENIPQHVMAAGFNFILNKAKIILSKQIGRKAAEKKIEEDLGVYIWEHFPDPPEGFQKLYPAVFESDHATSKQ